MKKVHLLLILCFLSSIPAISEIVSKTIYLSTAGTLCDSLSIKEQSSVTHLAVKGNIDARDFKTMRDCMPKLENLNLANSEIQSYFGYDGTSPSDWGEYYSENELPCYAFYHSKEYKTLLSVILPSTITAIGQKAFYYCGGLTSMTIPTGVTNINQEAFALCKGLAEIAFPSSVTTIGAYAFISCSGLTSIHLSSSTTTIEPFAFAYCKGLANVTLSSDITTIGSQAFAHCSGLASLHISSSVLYIGEEAFAYCDVLTSIKIPASVESLGMRVLYGCIRLDSIIVNDSNLYYSSKEGVLFDKNQSMLLSYPIARDGAYSIPSTVNNIEMYAFANCANLASISIPSSVISIGAYAFSSCSSLSSITIPESITAITTQSFANCTGLTAIHLKSTTPPEVESDGLLNVSRTNCTIYVPKGMHTFYINAPTWSEFTNIVEEDPSIPARVEADPEFRIYAESGELVIESPEVNQPIQIFTVNGTPVRVLCTQDVKTSIAFPKGIYIVKVGNQTTKVAL